MVKEVSAFAPATVSNVGCGFDVLGFALERPGDTVHLQIVGGKGVAIEAIEGDNGVLPTDPEKNTATVPILEAIKRGYPDLGLRLTLKKHMPIGSGMGSSAASAVAGIVAYNHLIGNSIPLQEQLELALLGEQVACGAAHADNAAPSLFGGFVLIRSYEPLDIVELPVPDELYCALVHPDYVLHTAQSRAVVPKQLHLSNAIAQWGNVGGLVAALFKNDYELLARSVVDYVAEPYRADLIPGYRAVKATALQQHALACNISGSGPSIFALFKGKEQANMGGMAMLSTLEKCGLKGQLYVSGVSKVGARIVS